MYVHVDLTDAGLRLEQPDDFTRFHIEADGDRHDVLAVLGDDARLGRTHHLWWSIEAVRRLAPPHADAAWWQNFEAMLAYAARKGWIDSAATHVQVHIENPSGRIVTAE